MAVLLDRGPPELQRWTEQLIRRLDDPTIHHVLPPFAAARLDRAARSFTQFLQSRMPPRDEYEVAALFALARAGIRISHVISSPWYFTFTRDVARRARWASWWQASRRILSDEEAAKARGDFNLLKASLFDQRDGYSVHEILETHVIVEGLQASMHKPEPIALYQFAIEFYREAPQNLRLLAALVDHIGVEPGVRLAPRLCAAALEFPMPSLAFDDMWRALDKHRDRLDELIHGDATRFFSAFRLDPATAARSTRERRVERRRARETDRRAKPVRGATFIREQRRVERRRTESGGDRGERQPDQPVLEAGGWGETMRSYFDRYEALPDIESKLQATVHPMRAAPGGAGALFMPAWAIYTDGRAADLREQPGDLSAYARWVTSAIDVLDGIAWLSDTPGEPDATG